MSKHTKGPWQVSGIRQRMDGEQWHVVGPDDTGWIAAVIYSDFTPELHHQSLADARLIAAAPDLLEALKEVVAISDREHKAWDKARAAIAKAEGLPLHD